jgi:predicted XRE-type DNA-binding protein
MKKNKYIGSDFDTFLKDENILEEAEALAIKRVIAYQLERTMKKQRLNQTEMSKRLKTSRAAIKRLLDPKNASVTLLTLHKAARVLGKQLWFELR